MVQLLYASVRVKYSSLMHQNVRVRNHSHSAPIAVIELSETRKNEMPIKVLVKHLLLVPQAAVTTISTIAILLSSKRFECSKATTEL